MFFFWLFIFYSFSAHCSTSVLRLNRMKNKSHFLFIHKKNVLLLLLILGILGVAQTYRYLQGVEATQDNIDEDKYKVFMQNIPKDINFAGELVPIHNFEVREQLDKEIHGNSYSRSQTILFHKRANRWFPVIKPILKQNHIPEDFKYVALIESELVNSISKRGASGFWQFIPNTAAVYGLTINNEMDERLNVEKSTKAACDYFKDAYKVFKNWTLVAASYNMGINGLLRQLKAQEVNNYYDLHLNKETKKYLFKILAVKEIISRPEIYGFKIQKNYLHPFIPVIKYEIDSSINNLSTFALFVKTDYTTLKMFNPWLLTEKLTNLDKRKFIIQIPKKDISHYPFLLIDKDSMKKNTLKDTLR